MKSTEAANGARPSSKLRRAQAPATQSADISPGNPARLSRAGVPGLMSEDCVAGACARRSFDEGRAPMPASVDFTAIYSRRDGIVDWRACVDPLATPLEVRVSHIGMALDPRVIVAVTQALRSVRSVVEVDRGEIA